MREQDLNALVEKALWLVNFSLNSNRIDVVRHLEPDLPKIWLDYGKMEQVFINLFTNAIHAMSGGGTLFVTTYSKQGTDIDFPPATDELPTQVIIEIQDTGTGISSEHLARLFTPFFTTKKKGLGTGLGLSVTKSIIELHGGHINLNNAPEGGVQVTVALNATKDSIYEKSTDTVCG
jgi:two-component system, NtrC family, sensor kinase